MASMTEPTFDTDGYPTEATLKEIEMWPYNDVVGFFRFIEQAWSYSNYFTKEGRDIKMSTGGWSGNESIMGAMKGNVNHIWRFTWVSSRRGGHYEFEIQGRL